MTIEWIEHNGKKILYSCYSNLSEDEMIGVIEEQAEICKKSDQKLLLLDDFRDSTGSSNFINRTKELGKTIINDKTKKNAILGVTGLKKALLKAYVALTGADIRPFNTKKDALEYLAAD